ncbi:hypothetical protein [Paenibacillus senegalimassiliensis]|uniref:hypothetical protein n=1 Tax=Paenibacillus senegalimassiliensis TaxID=1737426 RepID=UPI0011DE3150|nr:hypothetical protein [Paenibacillus senegalimassiliensis]
MDETKAYGQVPLSNVLNADDTSDTTSLFKQRARIRGSRVHFPQLRIRITLSLDVLVAVRTEGSRLSSLVDTVKLTYSPDLCLWEGSYKATSKYQ